MAKRFPAFYPGPADTNHPDWSTDPGAHKLAARIEDVWRAHGHSDVKVWVERQSLARNPGLRNEATIPVIRCNLVNGLPPSMAGS